jgi:hypothetical protein
MNLRRGLFRLWIIFTVLWCLVVAGIGGYVTFQQFQGQQHKQSLLARGLVPINLYDSQDPARATALSNQCEAGYIWSWCDLSVFRKIFPEYNALSDNELKAKILKKANNVDAWRPAPTLYLGNTLLIALIVPSLLFVLGYAITWAFSGFRPDMD